MNIPAQEALPKKVDVCRGNDLWTISTPTIAAYQAVIDRHKDTASYITIWRGCGCAKRYYQNGTIQNMSTCLDGWSNHD
jgi:hypothetical protein